MKLHYLLAAPTWILTNAIAPFLPSSHPWRWRWFTLEDWYKGQTPLTVQFDMVFWFTIIAILEFMALRVVKSM